MLYLIILLLAATATSDAPPTPTADITDTVKEVFKVQPGGRLYVDIDFGNVTIETIDIAEVRIELVRTVTSESADEAKRVFERHEYGFDKRGNDVHVSSRYHDGSMFWRRSRDRMKLEARIQVPARYDVDFSTGAGNVVLDNLSGAIAGRTGAGNIEVRSANGPVEVSSGSGNIDVRGCSGHLKISTGAGNVNVYDAACTVSISSGAGNLTARFTGQPDGNSSLETGAGNVTVHLASDARVSVAGASALGSVSTDFSLPIEGKWMSKSFAGDVNGGGPSIRMRAAVGNVVLRSH